MLEKTKKATIFKQMSREIKFRVWDKIAKKWVKNIPIIRQITNEFLYLNKDTKDIIFQQLTGLKDEKDKEIYEGDILVIADGNPPEYSNSIVTVEWMNNGWGYRDINDEKIESIYGLIGDANKDDCAEIIGNIFQNPELLKK